MNKEKFEKVCKRIESYRNDMIELQKKLIASPAIGPENGGQGEAEKAKILEPLVREIFNDVQVIKAKDDRVESGYRPNIIGKMKGKTSDRTIWFMAHMDIVPADEHTEWKTPPFEGIVKDGKIFGRGAEDDNQGLVSILFAAKALKEEGITPNFNMGLLFIADEETEQSHGPKYISHNCKNLFKKKDMIVVPDGGNSEGSSIEIAEKAIAWFIVTIRGKQSHAARPDTGINSHKAGAYLTCKINELYKIYPQKNEIFDVPYSTFEPTLNMVNTVSINTIPSKNIIGYDCRLLPEINYSEFIKKVESFFKETKVKFGVTISYEMLERMEAAPPTPKNSLIIKLLSKSIEEINSITPKPTGVGGGTVAVHFRKKGMHVVVYAKQPMCGHTPNEYCVVENMISDTKIWTHILMQKIK